MKIGLILLEHTLFKIFTSAQNNDEKSKLLLLENFRNTVRYYSKKLNYECAETDLNIFLLTLMKNLNLSKLKKLEEKAFTKYVYTSIKHEYIRLSKKNSYINSHEVLSDINIIDYIDSKKMELPTENMELIKNIVNTLSKKQKRVYIYFFIYGYSDTKTAKIIGISKQAVGRMRKRIVAKIKNLYKELI